MCEWTIGVNDGVSRTYAWWNSLVQSCNLVDLYQVDSSIVLYVFWAWVLTQVPTNRGTGTPTVHLGHRSYVSWLDTVLHTVKANFLNDQRINIISTFSNRRNLEIKPSQGNSMQDLPRILHGQG
jgi:hypothetical protein